MKKNDFFLALMLTIAALMTGQNSALAQATQEVGVRFSYQQKGNDYYYYIEPLILNGSVFESVQTSNSVYFDKTQVFNIGDNNIPLTMTIFGSFDFTDGSNFTAATSLNSKELTFSSTTKYIMGARVTTSSGETVSGCTFEGIGSKSVIVNIPSGTTFSSVILTIANHTPFDKDNSATISGIEDTYLDDGVNEPVPTVTYRESSGSAPITLTAGTDYTVSYSNNHYLGTATLTVTGTGNYIGSVSKDYVIRSYDLSDFNKLGDNIFEIATKDDLDHLAIYVNRDNPCQGVTFRQTNDIAYTHTKDWDAASTENNYTAIGGYGKPFKGTYDGQGHAISGIRIKKDDNDKANASSQGFIGYLGSGGTVKNVIVKDAQIDAYTNVGGIVGYNEGTVSDCIAYHVRVFSRQNMADVTTHRGPITGYNDGGTVTRCHNRDCAAPDYVNGKYINHRYTDDLFDLTLGTNVTASKTSGESVTIDGTTYYTEGSTFTLAYSGTVPAGYSMSYTATGGTIDGNTLTIPDYDVTVSLAAKDFTDDGHDGSYEDPYIIYNKDQLVMMASKNDDFSGKHIKLANDIDMSGVTNYNGYFIFKGHFDGNGKTISNLTINFSGDDVGLFGIIQDGIVENLMLFGATITGGNYVGGIAGASYSGAIRNCTVVGSRITATFKGTDFYAGAIVGYNSQGTLTNNYYYNCSCSNHINTQLESGIGVGGDNNYLHHDVTENDGAVQATFVTRSGAVTIIEKENGRHAIIDGNYLGDGVVNLEEDIEVKDVTFIRTFPTDAYCTLVLPFEISTSKLTGVNSVLSFEYMTNDENGMLECAMSIVWEEFMDPVELQPFTPYIVLMNNPHLGINTTSPVMFERTRDAFTEKGDWEYRGIYSYKVWDQNSPDLGRVYGFAATAVTEDKIEIGDFVRAEAGAYIYPLRAYLYYTGSDTNWNHSQSLRRAPAIDELPDRIPVRIVDDEVDDRISLTPALSKGEGDWYIIDGRKLDKQPTAKGLYINGGKVVVVK